MTQAKSCEGRNRAILREIKEIFSAQKNVIDKRLMEFEKVGQGENNEIFTELVFCILTPQAKAKTCWYVVLNLKKKGLLFDGDTSRIAQELSACRFKNKKASYIIKARKVFSNNGKSVIKSELERADDSYDLRGWLVQNVKGLGYKEASHFLRNIGLGENLAILDRHILKNLYLLGVIEEIPKSLPVKRYLDIEKKMRKFAIKTGIPMSHLDLVLWYKETGEIFK